MADARERKVDLCKRTIGTALAKCRTIVGDDTGIIIQAVHEAYKEELGDELPPPPEE